MKLLKTILTMILVCAASSAYSVPMIYTFEGTVTGFQSYHQDYDINDFDITIGQTPLNYVFEVDFDADNHSLTNSAGTWNYFYTDLLSGSIINGGLVYGDYYGFNWGESQIGQITSNLADVRITASGSKTQDWMVHDWTVGQLFNSTDLACYPDGVGGCAVYAFGEVMLMSIESVAVDEPYTIWLDGLGLLIILLSSRVRFSKLRKGSAI